jgi:hypothetical protein
MNNRYNNGLIYKIVCKDPSITDCYIGSCCNFTRRKCEHKSSCINKNSKKYNQNNYKFIRENGGWDNWSMIQIKKYPCETKRDLELEERKYLEQLKATLNTYIPTRTNKEWVNNNKDKVCKTQKKYNEKNKEAILLQQKQYREKNKETILLKQKQYREKNKETIICECGGKYITDNKNRHFKTIKHINKQKELLSQQSIKTTLPTSY